MLQYSKFQERPIPESPNPPTALDYAGYPVDQVDPRAQEPLVNLADYEIAGNNFYARCDGLNTPYRRCFPASDQSVHVRKSLAERLSDINEELTNIGLELYALNGFRPLSVQQELWDYFIAQSHKTLVDPTEDECVKFAGTYCSDPRKFNHDDPYTWPTHITGGALDLTLRNKKTKEHLFFGSIFDDPSEVTHTSLFENRLNAVQGNIDRLTLSEQEALQNRRLLYWSTCSAGFTNYPFEWWHFDLGTQLWAAIRQSSKETENQQAWYGPATNHANTRLN